MGKRANGKRFRQTWHSLKEDVTVGEQRYQQPLHHVFLTNDDLSNLGRQVIYEGAVPSQSFVDGYYIEIAQS